MPRATRWIEAAQVSDAAANDSDKTFTVPASKTYIVHSVAALLVSTSDAGNRQLDVLLTDASDNVIAKYVAGAVQPQSQSYTYVFAVNHPQETGFTGDVMLRALGENIPLPGGYKIRVYASAAIQATADDLTVRIMVELIREE